MIESKALPTVSLQIISTSPIWNSTHFEQLPIPSMSNLNKYSVGGLATVHEQTGATSQQPTPSAAGQTQFHRPIAANNNNNNNYPSYGQAYHIQPPTNEMEMGGDGDDSDDGETGMMGGTGNTQGSASGGKTRAGRRKILIQYIEDKGRRHITFSKRKAGIMKKVKARLFHFIGLRVEYSDGDTSFVIGCQ